MHPNLQRAFFMMPMFHNSVNLTDWKARLLVWKKTSETGCPDLRVFSDKRVVNLPGAEEHGTRQGNSDSERGMQTRPVSVGMALLESWRTGHSASIWQTLTSQIYSLFNLLCEHRLAITHSKALKTQPHRYAPGEPWGICEGDTWRLGQRGRLRISDWEKCQALCICLLRLGLRKREVRWKCGVSHC